MSAFNKIKNGQVVDESGLKDLLSSRDGKGMIYDENLEESKDIELK